MTVAPRLLLACLLCAPASVLAQAWTLDEATWARPRDARAVLSMAPLPAAIEAWSRRPGGALVIHHAGGETGELWAHELQDWMVALGVPTSALSTAPGGEPGVLRLELTGGRE